MLNHIIFISTITIIIIVIIIIAITIISTIIIIVIIIIINTIIVIAIIVYIRARFGINDRIIDSIDLLVNVLVTICGVIIHIAQGRQLMRWAPIVIGTILYIAIVSITIILVALILWNICYI
jgi:hypothetical protein